jgi:hypothetical protein
MEDNHYVIMDKYPSNQLIERIQMESNKMFPLTLKPAKKRKTTQVVYDTKYVQYDTAFTIESAHNSKEGKSSA